MSRAVSRTPLLLATGLVGLVVVLALGMYVYDHTRRDQIAKGVEIDGIGVGGMSSSAARAKLERYVKVSMERPVRVERDGRAWTLLPRRTGVDVDVTGSVDHAVQASREGSIFTRTWRGITGAAVRRDLPLSVTYSHARLREFAARVKQAIDRPARDATVQASAAGLTAVPAQVGLSVFRTRLERGIAHALTSVDASRTVSVPAHAVKPAVTTGELAAKYPAYIIVNRGSFQLRYYSHLKLASTFPIAVGMQGLETPPGLYHIQWKQVNPPWYVPNSAWAGKLAGKTIPPGPEDPLKARFMSFDGGAGIHGIDPSEYGSIGHDASHGCVRMRIPDVIALYARTPVGTPVYIV
jgi:lipoprotein-anchoring transpeptidase ErfK/SrfK